MGEDGEIALTKVMKTVKNHPFNQDLYDVCGRSYYNGFIDGCMSVEGNTREDCDSATDA